MGRGVSGMVTSVRGVLRTGDVLRSSTTCLAIRSAAVGTGTTACSPRLLRQQLATTTTRHRRLIIVGGGWTVSRVCSSSCVAGARGITIPPLDYATMETSPVCCCSSICSTSSGSCSRSRS